MAGRFQRIAGPGLERSQTDAQSTRIRRPFELSQKGLITCCGFYLSPIQVVTSVGTGLSTPTARRGQQGTTLKMRTGVIVAPVPGIRFTREDEARLP